MSHSSRNGQMRAPQVCVGARNGFAFALAFTAWAKVQRERITPTAIMERWKVSRATAYRYRDAWETCGKESRQ